MIGPEHPFSDTALGSTRQKERDDAIDYDSLDHVARQDLA